MLCTRHICTSDRGHVSCTSDRGHMSCTSDRGHTMHKAHLHKRQGAHVMRKRQGAHVMHKRHAQATEGTRHAMYRGVAQATCTRSKVSGMHGIWGGNGLASYRLRHQYKQQRRGRVGSSWWPIQVQAPTPVHVEAKENIPCTGNP